MNFPDQLLPPAILWVSALCALPLLARAAVKAPWRQLNQDNLLNVWLGMCVAVMVLWSIKTGVKPGLNFHLLGATLMTLMFGARLALVGLAVVLCGVTLAGHAGWSSFGINLLLTAALPVFASHLLFTLADRKLPNHLFIYIFIDAFAGSALAIVLTGATASLVLAWSGVYGGSYLTANYLPYYILIGWSEAMMTGMVVTLMAAFRPQWLMTFDDDRYLRNKPRNDR